MLKHKFIKGAKKTELLQELVLRKKQWDKVNGKGSPSGSEEEENPDAGTFEFSICSIFLFLDYILNSKQLAMRRNGNLKMMTRTRRRNQLNQKQKLRNLHQKSRREEKKDPIVKEEIKRNDLIEREGKEVTRKEEKK